MQELQEGLAAMRRRLEVHGFDLYQINCTSDFTGTMDREALVQHLENAHGFSQQGDFAFPEEGGRILDNTGSVRAHVCTFVQTRNSRATSTKFYSKDISQIEAGEIRETFGGHLAHLADSPNQHLRRTLAHPVVRTRGCTRIEISLHACEEGDLFANSAERLLERHWPWQRHARLRRKGARGLWGARSVRGAAGVQEVGEPRAAPGPLLAAGRPPARVHRPGAERPQQDRTGAGEACSPFAGGGGKRRAMGKGHAVDDGGLRPPQLSRFPNGDPGDGGGRGPLLAAASLHQGRPNNPGGPQQALRAAPGGSGPGQGAAANRARGVGLAEAEDPPNRHRETVVRAARGARNRCRAMPFHTVHKGTPAPPKGAVGGGGPLGLGGTDPPSRRKAHSVGRRAGCGAGKRKSASGGDRGEAPRGGCSQIPCAERAQNMGERACFSRTGGRTSSTTPFAGEHENNWCADWGALQNAAKESSPGPAILARVPGEKAWEWGHFLVEPVVALGHFGRVVLCIENGI